jgi:serine phosphatase RsbU (regulator of sigma subunit)/anti-sigma regulatory factor (Ser/Thr protein kinase)
MVNIMRRRNARSADSDPGEVASSAKAVPSIPIPDDDPLAWHLLSVAGPVELSKVPMSTPSVERLREAGIELVVPLIGQGELMGALYLGPRLSDQPYSADDRKLLSTLAGQVAPAMRVAQLVQEQQVETKEREQIQQELKVAAFIQQTLLPKTLPDIAGWTIDAFYRPARAVGGDFYDFIPLDDGRLGVVIGDVTDKGVPAALVMATCRSTLRAAALLSYEPGEVLANVNDALVDEIPPAMFVTCLYAIVDTDSGMVSFANAGHNLPYVRTDRGVIELRATGMPLGLMRGMHYEESTHDLEVGEVMVLTSDGITEAHNPDGEMYGFSRLMARVAKKTKPGDTVSGLISELETWTGPIAEQEDDITLVVVRRSSSARDSAAAFDTSPNGHGNVLDSFDIPSIEGNERTAIDRVAQAVAGQSLPTSKLERLKTAVGETVMNAIEHGNHGDESLTVAVEVRTLGDQIAVRVTDHGGGLPKGDAPLPDLEAKLAGEQTPRGWGLFLVEQMVDEVQTIDHDGLHTVELVVTREGGV